MFFEKDLVGVDIGTSSVKVVGLKKKAGKYLLMKRPCIEPIPRGLIQQGGIENINELASIVKRLMQSKGFISKLKRCAISLGGNIVLVRRMEVDVVRSDQVDVSDQILQVAQQTFSNFDDLYWSYSVLPSSYDGQRKSVVLCAAKIDEVERYVSLMRRVGMRVGVIDAGVLCVANTFAYNCSALGGMHLILDIGASHSVAVCILNGEYCFSKALGIAGDYYTSAIATEVGVEMNRAEMLKLSVSDGGATAEVNRVLQNVHQALTEEVSQCVEHFDKQFANKYGNESLRGVFLLGGGSLVYGLTNYMSGQLNVPVNCLNPFYRTSVKLSGSHKKEIQAYSPFYGVSFGLGIRRVDMDKAS